MDSNRPAKNVAVLGATGSIGTATVEVIRHLDAIDPQHAWRMYAASGHSKLEELARLSKGVSTAPQRMVFSDPESADRYSAGHTTVPRCRVDVGPDALVSVAADPEVDILVAAIVGRAGLESTLAGVRSGKRIALANKETLVVAGPLVRKELSKSGAEIIPVDSEHSAIFQCLGPSGSARDNGDSDAAVSNPQIGSNCSDPASRAKAKRVILTASGGPFRGWTTEQMSTATRDSALAHPTWNMGPKITIDSATMMNKALEIIEAKWLFDLPADAIEVVVHPQSIIHSMVAFDDGSVIAQMSPPDMRLPIQYALTFPDRLPGVAPELDCKKPWDLTLEPADHERFPALDLGFEVARAGGTAGAVVNAANEEAVGLFLDEQIRFTDIVSTCRKVLESHTFEADPPLERLLELDRWARSEVKRVR